LDGDDKGIRYLDVLFREPNRDATAVVLAVRVRFILRDQVVLQVICKKILLEYLPVRVDVVPARNPDMDHKDATLLDHAGQVGVIVGARCEDGV
jgi:hypothetical protein